MSRLKEIGIGSRGLERNLDSLFRLQTRHIPALVERHLPAVQTPNFWKVLILCCEKVPERDRNFAVIGGVMDVYLICPVATFFDMEEAQKKRFVLNAVCQGLSMVAAHTGIGKTEFAQAIEASKGLVNEWYWPKAPRSSPNRQWKACLFCQHDLDKFTAHLVVVDKHKNELARSFFFEAPPSEFQFVPKMAAPEWISNNEIAVGDQKWSWNAEKNKLRQLKG